MKIKVLFAFLCCILFACSKDEDDELPPYFKPQFLLEKELNVSSAGDSVIVKTRDNFFFYITTVTVIQQEDTVWYFRNDHQTDEYNFLQVIPGEWYTIRTMPEELVDTNDCYVYPSFISIVLTPNRTGAWRKLWIGVECGDYFNSLEFIQDSE